MSRSITCRLLHCVLALSIICINGYSVADESVRVKRLVDESKAKRANADFYLLNDNPLKLEDLDEALKYIGAHHDYSSYELLLALRKYYPEKYKGITNDAKAAILCSALLNLNTLNDWGYLSKQQSFDDDSAKALLEVGTAAIKPLTSVLESDKAATFYGTKEATRCDLYKYRVKDFACRYLSILSDLPPPVFELDPKVRDKDIDSLRKSLRDRSK